MWRGTSGQWQCGAVWDELEGNKPMQCKMVNFIVYKSSPSQWWVGMVACGRRWEATGINDIVGRGEHRFGQSVNPNRSKPAQSDFLFYFFA